MNTTCRLLCGRLVKALVLESGYRWWWDEVKASCPRPVREDHDPALGEIELILATISLWEFDPYWEPVVPWYVTAGKSVELTMAAMEKLRKTQEQKEALIDAERAKLGWRTSTWDYDPEVGVEWPETIVHKYFIVKHRHV